MSFLGILVGKKHLQFYPLRLLIAGLLLFLLFFYYKISENSNILTQEAKSTLAKKWKTEYEDTDEASSGKGAKKL